MVPDYRLDRDERLVPAVVRAVGEFTGRPATTLPPLYDTVDSDALGRLVDAGHRAGTTVEFRYCDCQVAIEDDMISVSPTPGEP